MTTRYAGVDSLQPKNLFVGVFDVLGFKNIIDSLPLLNIQNKYKELTMVSNWSTVVPVLGLPVLEEWVVPFSIFSDTTLLWADDESDALEAFLSACAEIMARSLDIEWPLRGGIAFDECMMNRPSQVFIGKAVVRAHETERAQEWIGAALHPTCLLSKRCGSLLRSFDTVKAYNVPTKPKCKIALELAINWTTRVYDAPIRLMELSEKQAPEMRLKYEAALAFARCCKLSI